jgi:rubrerythrin
MKMIDDEDDVLSNREKTLRPRKTKFWCGFCDRAIVRPWVKCPVCGHRNGKKRLLK